MNELTREMALRIGLAAKVLPGVEPARLMKVLDAAIGLPPSEAALRKLNVKSLKSAANGELSALPSAELKFALSCLRGEDGSAALDAPEPLAKGAAPVAGTIRVAIASNAGEALDGHFGSCLRFLIYQISKEEARLIDVRSTADADESDDKNAARADLIADCSVLFVVSIGGPAAAKVVRRDVHPIKAPEGGSARDVLENLRQVLMKAPPPWLAKAMGRSAPSRRWSEEEDEA